MDISQIQDYIRTCSAETEGIYTRMGTGFPSLLAITGTADEASTLPALKSVLANLAEGFSSYAQDEVSFFERYNEKNSALFNALNDKMAVLGRINERVSAIRTDSEELEIISLNAMVISIKSGEKGRAFSCITENLKKLSARMISLSNELIQDEKKLVEKNEALKKSFSAVLEAQKEVVTAGVTRHAVDLKPIILSASEALVRMTDLASGIGAPIREAMAGVQMQDIIRQSLDQVLLALPEICQDKDSLPVEERLDRLTFDTELLDVCVRIVRDVCANVESSLQTFSGNWKNVHDILDSVETQRLAIIANFLDERSGSASSVPVQLRRLTEGFSNYIAHINLYQRGQKTMVKDSSMIVSEVKRLRVLFDTIRPIIARLQHVRITQQIEVAKNEAIRGVHDTVEHMSELIMQADIRVKDTRAELEAFIAGIEDLTVSFSAGAEADQLELERIKHEKTDFFNRMQGYHDAIADIVLNLRVYPDSFQQLCAEIDGLLARLQSIRDSLGGIAGNLEGLAAQSRAERDRLLGVQGLQSWSIHNDRFRELVERFTITAHKEVAGKIGGFDIESGSLDSIESGDVTLFF